MSWRALAGAMVVAAVFQVSPVAAQDSRRFNKQQLEATYQLPVYVPRGGASGNEIIEDINRAEGSQRALYAVRDDLKKVLAFYREALGEPKERTNDVGLTTYTFHKPEGEKDKEKVHRSVKVNFDAGSRMVQVTLVKRKYHSADDLID